MKAEQIGITDQLFYNTITESIIIYSMAEQFWNSNIYNAEGVCVCVGETTKHLHLKLKKTIEIKQ